MEQNLNCNKPATHWMTSLKYCSLPEYRVVQCKISPCRMFVFFSWAAKNISTYTKRTEMTALIVEPEAERVTLTPNIVPVRILHSRENQKNFSNIFSFFLSSTLIVSDDAQMPLLLIFVAVIPVIALICLFKVPAVKHRWASKNLPVE